MMMENVNPSLFTAQQLADYLNDRHLCDFEHDLAQELRWAIEAQDTSTLSFFQQFGDNFRQIFMNVNSYRHGVNYGFTAIKFDQYGWLKRARFIDIEEFSFADAKRFDSASKLEIGHGPNGKWTYGLWCTYGTAGSCSGLSVYPDPYPTRQAAINAGIAELKANFAKVLGNPDTLNYKQAVIVKTLADIAAFTNSQAQLTLF